MSALAYEARGAVARLGRPALAKRHAHLEPRHALDERSSKGWRALSPSVDPNKEAASSSGSGGGGGGAGLRAMLTGKIAAGTGGSARRKGAGGGLDLSEISRAFIRSK